jgi:hypothetical protein
MTKADARERTYHTCVHICRYRHNTGLAYTPTACLSESPAPLPRWMPSAHL